MRGSELLHCPRAYWQFIPPADAALCEAREKKGCN